MDEYGVLCTMGDGEPALITVTAPTPGEAQRQVFKHQSVFGGSDGAGRWLASVAPASTIVKVGEVRPLAEWNAAA